jgi:hypothetical protein
MGALDNQVGSTVTIEGTARNAMAGAIVQMADRTPVYIEGLERWDSAHDGKPVSASGTLRREGGDEVVNSKGERSSGFAGGKFVLEGPTWKLA